MTARFGRATWSLVVADGWRAWHDDECATLVDGENIGALQVSAAFKDTTVEDADLRDFAADHLDAGATPRWVTAGDFVGFEIAFDDGRPSWRQWYLRSRRQMLFAAPL